MIVGTAIAIGFVSLMWGGRAYFMAHRTESDNQAAVEKEQDVMMTPDMNVNSVEEIRKKIEEERKQKRLEEDRKRNEAARQSSDEYLKALEGKKEDQK
jgi:signal recognition particle GTPase